MKSKEQAIAIGLSEARAKGKKVPTKKSAGGVSDRCGQRGYPARGPQANGREGYRPDAHRTSSNDGLTIGEHNHFARTMRERRSDERRHGSHPDSKTYPPDRLIPLREEEAREAGAELGLSPEDMLFLRLPDRFVPTKVKGRARDRLYRDCAGKSARAPSLSAGDMIPIATMGRPSIARRFRVGSAE